MGKSIWVVTTRCTDPSREEEFNRWYDEVHLPDLLKVPGLVAAQRYRFHGHTPMFPPPEGAPEPTYVAIYEFESDGPPPDPQAIIAMLQTAVPDIADRTIDYIEVVSATMFTALGERQVARSVPAGV